MCAKTSLSRLCLLLASFLAATLFWFGPGSGSGDASSHRKRAFRVTETAPAGGTDGVAADTPIIVVLSEEIDFKSVTSSSFEVVGSSSGKKSGAYSHVPGSLTITFAPAHGFAAAETVRVRLARKLRSLAKRALTPAEFSFTVQGSSAIPAPPPTEPSPPTGPVLSVTASAPHPFQLNVPLEQDVSLAFSEAVEASTINAATVWLLSERGGRVPASLALLNGGVRLVVGPSRGFGAGETITVNLSREIKAVSGAPFGGLTFQFRARAAASLTERGQDHVFTAIGRVSRLLSADLNLDRLADVVYSAENETVIDVLLGRGDGTLLPALRIDAGQPVLALAVADVDADGDPDILVGTQDRALVYWNRSMEKGASPGSIRFEVGPIAPTGTAVRSIAVADIDHRGLPDVILDTDRGLFVYLGGLGAPVSQTIGSSRLSRTQVVLADIDLDGHADLVFGDRHGGRVTYYLSNGSADRPFVAESHVDIGADAEQIAVEDLGGDGVPEIIALTIDAASSRGAAFRILSRAGSTYTVNRGASSGAAGVGGGDTGDVLDTGRFALADLDGNGLPDLILAAAAAGKVIWFPNVGGKIDFAGGGKEILGVPNVGVPMAADLAGDGVLDVLAAGNNEIHALLPIEGPPPPPQDDGTFKLSIDDAQVRQKDVDATATVRLTNSKPLQAYSAAIHYDGRAVVPLRISTDGTITGTSAVEFSDSTFYADASAVSFKVIVEFGAPFEDRTIPAGDNQLLFRLYYNVLETAPLGDTSFDLIDGVGDPRIPTEVVVEGLSVKPETSPGKLTVLPPKEPPPPPDVNQMKLGTAQVAPGAEGGVPVLGTVEKNAEAFTSIVSFDKSVIEVLDLDLSGSITAELHPDLVVPNILNEEGHALLTVLFDFTPPFEKQTIPPGTDRLLFTVKFRAHADAVLGTYPIAFENRVGTPPLNNIYVFDGLSVFPELIAGEIRIDLHAPPVFLRGDFDSSGVLDLSDAIALVNYLFKGGSEPGCLDAGDSDDSGLLDLTDAILLLNHLFKGGTPPALPYPDPGTDPTRDDLGCNLKA